MSSGRLTRRDLVQKLYRQRNQLCLEYMPIPQEIGRLTQLVQVTLGQLQELSGLDKPDVLASNYSIEQVLAGLQTINGACALP